MSLSFMNDYREQQKKLKKDYTFAEYFEIVRENPKIAGLSHARIYDMVMADGTENGAYNFFSHDLFGMEKPLQQLIEGYFGAAAQRMEVRKRIILLMGPVSGGKSSICTLLKRGLERYTRTDEGAVYAIKGCPMHEEPLHLIPHELREQIQREHGIYIEGDLCPACEMALREQYDGVIENMPVERVVFSEKHRVGIGTFAPSDPKCVTGDALVLTSNGLRTMEDIFISLKVKPRVDEFVDFDATVIGMDGPDSATKFYNGGRQPVYEVRTNLGYSIRGTANHPLLVAGPNGQLIWRKIGDIQVGDSVALARGQHVFSPEHAPLPDATYPIPLQPTHMDRDLAYWLGLQVAEGMISAYEVSFSNLSTKLIDEYVRLTQSLFGLNAIPRRKGPGYAYNVTISNKALASWLRGEIGIGRGSGALEIPPCVLRSTEDDILAFLDGLFWGDGTLRGKRNGTNLFSYSTKSRQLASQVQVVLLNLGVPSSMYTETIEEQQYYSVTVRGDCVLDLVELIPSLSDKATAPIYTGRTSAAKYESLPFGTTLLSGHGKDRYLRRVVNGARPLTRFRGQRVLAECPHMATKALIDLLERNYLWLQVRSVESVGMEPVYDLLVPRSHSFVGNGFYQHNSQDLSDLVGSIDLSTIGEYGTESDPRAYRFDGEMNIASRGLLEMVEMLKCQEQFLYGLLHLSQEQSIKTGRYAMIYADEVVAAHSIDGDVPVAYKKGDWIRWASIKELADRNDTDIEVVAMNTQTRKSEWTKVRSFYRHPFTGKMVRTKQRNGTITTTDCHSIYSTDYDCFRPEEKRDVLAIRELPVTAPLNHVDLQFPPEIEVIDGMARCSNVLGCQGNGEHMKNWLKASYDVRKDHTSLRALLKVLAWYVSEGHVNDEHAIISNNNVNELLGIKEAAESISTCSASFQDRSHRADKTSRLHLSSKVWKLFISHNCRRYSANVRIPDFIFNLPVDLKKYFFNELQKGDGQRSTGRAGNVGARSSPKYLDQWFRYKTISQTLAAQVCFLASQLGYDYSVSVGRTKLGKPAYCITYRERVNMGTWMNAIETHDVTSLEVFDIECEGNHSFMAGVGNIICHNSNEAEYSAFIANKKNEALQDRIILIKVPYNLRVSEEVKIYEKLIGQSGMKGTHIAPSTLKVASTFAILSRLETPKKAGMTLMRKLKLYDGEDTEGYTQRDVKELQEETVREGMDGISPRYVINCLSTALSKGVKCINPIDALRALKDGLEQHTSIGKERRDHLLNLIAEARKEYDDIAKAEVQKAFVHSFEDSAKGLFNNYLDNVEACCNREKLRDPITEEEMEPDEKLMRSIEEQIGITDNAKKAFREEILIRISSLARRGQKLDYKSHERLKEAIEKKLFADLKDVVKITTSAKNPDPEQQKRVGDVVDRLVKEHGYCHECARELLQYVGSLMQR